MESLFKIIKYPQGVFGVTDAVKTESVSVMKGDSVTLESGLTKIQRNDVIAWTFERPGTLIAQIDKEDKIFSTSDDVLDGRFRGRLKLDHQTGSLTITNTRNTDSGEYQINIRGMKTFTCRFSVTVYDSVHCCGPTEAVIRLVLSAVVGVATVIILVYDFRSRRAERDQAHIHTSVEAVIRLVVTALMGVAAVAAVVVLVYDIRSKRAELDQAHIHTSET
ncbi:hypothetical protein DPX16_4869 [Anabarilius grahami]|uniref:Immunoglobulin domain-containing protein n=1 Tax=Anabarilius grahami TaxID=495550 RepID=A0A3N0YJ85_ANAGA|nr:hypothetical protein DPX16_4869 [Anabarilius grahami]